MTTSSQDPVTTISGIHAMDRLAAPPPAWRTARLLALLALTLALAGTTAGCGTLVGYIVMKEPKPVVTGTTELTESVTIDSEPQGARIIKDGAPAGTTPAALDFTYQTQQREDHVPCWVGFALGPIDLATGAATIWAANRWWNRETILMLSGALYGGLGFLFSDLFGLACVFDKRELSPVTVPRRHTLTLAAGGSEESLILYAPTQSGNKRISTVIRGLEKFDWRRAKAHDTIAAYQDYLTKYPSGRWRQEARDGIEERHRKDADQLWQRAREQDTAAAYADYLDHCSPHCRDEARSRHWQAARRQDTVFAYTEYLDRCAPTCNDEARDRLVQLRSQERILAWWRSRPGHVVPQIPLDSIPSVVPALRAAGASTKDVVGMVADVAGMDRHVVGMVAVDSFAECLRALRQAGASTGDLARIITRNMQSVPGGNSLITFGKARITVWARSGKRSIVLDDRWTSALTDAGLAAKDIAALSSALLASGAGASQEEVRKEEAGYR